MKMKIRGKKEKGKEKVKAKEKQTSKRTRNKANRLITILVVIVGLAALFFAYGPSLHTFLAKVPFISSFIKIPQPTEKKADEELQMAKVVPVIAYKIAKEDFKDILPTMGTIKGQKEIEMRFEVNGVIDSINFREGDLIEAQDVIATLNEKDAVLKVEYSQSKLKTAKTQTLTAKKKLEIYQNLYKIGAIIKPKLEEIELEYENAKSQAVSAEKEVAFSKAELDKTYLLSPIDGVMGTKEAEPGEFITSQNKIASIVDIDSVFVEVGVIEKELQRIALGQMANITVDAYPETAFTGPIDNILPTIEGKSRTLTCKIKVENPEAKLLPGMFARANISVFEHDDVIVVPNSCLIDQDGDGTFDSTYVVTPEVTAKLKEVEPGYLTSDQAVISWGLEEGELVITEARGELSDGVKVEILETQQPLSAEPEVGVDEGLPFSLE